jgi:hypothetical protein
MITSEEFVAKLPESVSEVTHHLGSHKLKYRHTKVT